jgi:hypothetical protein
LLVVTAPPFADPSRLAPWTNFRTVGGIQQSCASDFEKFCKPSSPSSPVQTGCLRQYWMNLSASCQRALRAQQSNNADESDNGE